MAYTSGHYEMGGGSLSAGPHSEHTRRKPDCLCSQERYWNPCCTAKYLSRQRCCFNKQHYVPFLTALTKLVDRRCSALNTSLRSSRAQLDSDGSLLISLGLPIASPICGGLSRTKVEIMKRFAILFSLLLVLPLCIQSQENATPDNATSKPAKVPQPPIQAGRNICLLPHRESKAQAERRRSQRLPRRCRQTLRPDWWTPLFRRMGLGSSRSHLAPSHAMPA